MANVSVFYDGKEFIIENSGTKKRAVTYKANVGATVDRAFNILKSEIDYEALAYRVNFKEQDVIDAESYEAPGIGNFGVEGNIDPTWITAGKLNLQAWKMDMINQAFESKFGIQPMNADGTVKAEYTTP